MSTEVPDGYAHALHPITDYDHGGYAIIASGCSLVFVLIFAGLRLWNCARIGHSIDDFVLFAGTTLDFVQSALIIVAVEQGFGKFQYLLDEQTASRIQKILYASDLIYVVALYLSKISVLCLEMRLSVERTHLRLAKGILLFACIALLASFLMVALGCRPTQPWAQSSGECDGLYIRWIVAESLSCVIELFGFLLIVRVYVSLQTKFRTKIKGLITFSLRLLVVILAAYRLLSLRSLRASSNLSFDRMPLVAWTQVELAYSLITATIPCLMVFMGMLNTACGTLSPETVIARSQQESQKITGGSYELQTYQRSSRLRSQDHMRPEDVKHKWTVSSSQAEERSIGSDDSTGMIIRRTVEFSYKTESREGEH